LNDPVEELNMKSAFLISVLLSVCLFGLGCGSGIGNPFAGGQFDVGEHHLSFSHSVAEWDTAHDKLVLKFDLLTGSAFPYAAVTVEEVSTIQVDKQREVKVDIFLSEDKSYKSSPDLPDANAMITFSQFDLSPVGAVSGTISGLAQWVEEPIETPVDLVAEFQDVPIAN
jgi:hypothetical protein